MSEMPSSHNENETVIHNPFKGVSAYSESDKEVFYGRDTEKKDIIRIIKQNTLSLLYSSSGNGKSSLINAGIFPILKDLNNYFPVYIRLTEDMIAKPSNFSTAIIELIKKAAAADGILVNTKKLPEKPGITDFIYRSTFSNAVSRNATEPSTIIPVLVFDQFEELFSAGFSMDDTKALVDDLANLVESRIPVPLEQLLGGSASGNGDELLLLKDALQSADKWYRVLFSFREEYLPSFQTLKDEIPSLFYTNACYQLKAFSVDTAKHVIGNISRESVEIDETIAGHLASMLSRDKNSKGKFKEEVSPFFLSLVCKNLYVKIVAPKPDQEFIDSIIGEDDTIISDEIDKYAKSVFSKVSARTRKFIEEELITEDEKRTMHAFKNISREDIKAELELLTKDSNLRYLTFIEYFDAQHIEILHDRLLEPLLRSRKRRREREKNRKLFFILSGSLALLTVIAVWLIGENAKNRKYDQYITEQNTAFLSTARSNPDLLERPLKVLGSLIDHENRIKSLPIFNAALFPNQKALNDFRDSIRKLFETKPLANEVAGNRGIVSFKGTIKYTLRKNYFPAGRDTITLQKLNKDGGFDTLGNIIAPFSYNIPGSDHIAGRAFGDIEFPGIIRFSFEDSLLCIYYNQQFYIYKLPQVRKGGNIEVSNQYPMGDKIVTNFIFSLDSRMLIIHSDTTQFGRRNLYSSDGSARYFLYDNENYLNYRSLFYCLHLPEGTISPFRTDKTETLVQGYMGQDGQFVPVYLDSSGIVIPQIVPKTIPAGNGFFFDRKYLFLPGDSNICLVNRQTGKWFNRRTRMKNVSFAHFLNGTQQIAVIGKAGEVEIYDLADTPCVRYRQVLLKDLLASDAYTRYKNSFVSPDEKRIVINYYGNLEAISLDSFKGPTYKAYHGPMSSAHFNADTINLISTDGICVHWYYNAHFNNYSDLEAFYLELKTR